MNLNDLKIHTRTKTDQEILHLLIEMTKRFDNEISAISMTLFDGTLGNYNPGYIKERSIAYEALSSLNSDSFGGVGTMAIYKMFAKLYSQNKFDFLADINSNCAIVILKYLRRMIGKGEFVSIIHNLREALDISDNFHDYLIDYFMENHSRILYQVKKDYKRS